jgi:serine/threonine-protein kinase
VSTPGGQATATAGELTRSRRADERGADLAADEDVELEAGCQVGDFVIEHELGSGAYGTVYAARHPVIARRVAIKVLRQRFAAQARTLARFVEEARLVASLRHPHIVEVISFGRLDDGRAYQVMELIEGPTLAAFIEQRGALPPEVALPILRGVASALDAMHRAQIAHRDLKPANVMLCAGEQPKLIDFGIAKLVEGPRTAAATASGAILGTPRYMAPEQCRGKKVDGRADVYAFGLVAYELLTGRPAFSGEDALDLMLKHTAHAPAPPSTLVPTLHSEVDAVVLELLEKDPERRPRDLGAVVDALGRALARPSRRRPHVAWLLVPAIVAVPLWLGADRPGADARGRHERPGRAAAQRDSAALAPTSDRVAVTIDGAPAGTRVRDARGSELGTTPGPVLLPRGAAPMHLTLDKPGYASIGVEVTPTGDQRIVVALSPAPSPAARMPGLDDPESPFEPKR